MNWHNDTLFILHITYYDIVRILLFFWIYGSSLKNLVLVIFCLFEIYSIYVYVYIYTYYMYIYIHYIYITYIRYIAVENN